MTASGGTTEHTGVVDGPITDPRRVAAVTATGLLDTAPEEAFDRLTRLASELVEAPMVFVTLVDDQRSYWKSTTGFVPDPGARGEPVRQNHVGESFCQFVVHSGVGRRSTTPAATPVPATWTR